MFYFFDTDFSGDALSELIDYLALQSSAFGVVFQKYHKHASSKQFQHWVKTVGGELMLKRNWPGTKTQDEVCVAHIPVGSQTIGHLKEEITSLFSCEDSFEDLHFYRDDESVLFFVTSQEGYGFVDINDPSVLNDRPFIGRGLRLYEGEVW